MQQKSRTGSEGQACKEKRDSLLGQLLSESRLPGGEDSQAGQDEDSAENASPERGACRNDHFRRTAYSSIVPPRRRRTSNKNKAKPRGMMGKSAGKRRRDQIGY